MHCSLFLLCILPLSAAAPPGRGHHLRSANYLRSSFQESLPESIEVSRPLPFDSLNPSCTLPVLSHGFGDTVGLPAAVANYSPPISCWWSRAVLQLSASCNGSQSDRIAAVWLSGAELLRTSTPKPTSDGIFWTVRKDVSRYSSLRRKSNVSFVVVLENAVDGVNNGVYQLNLTIMYYNAAGIAATDVIDDDTITDSLFSLFPRSTEELRYNSEVVNLKDAFNLNENPADLIIPIASSGDKGFWFKIQRESDAANQTIQIPANTYKAVLEIYVSFHGNDESWYSNPPNSYIEVNHLPTKSGNGAYRKIEVKIDGVSVGSVIPFPVIFTGGINPLFWKPLAPIGAFTLPSYQLLLTPFLSTLLDGKNHSFELRVTDAISYWLVDANLHLWLDGGSDKVLAGAIKYRNPNTRVERKQKFRLLDGRATVQGKRKGEFSGWVSYSAGNFTTTVEHNIAVENTVEFKEDGTEKHVKQQVELRTKVKVKAYRQRSSDVEVESKYYLHATVTKLPNLAKDTDLTIAKLKNRLQEKKEKGQQRSNLDNTQQCSGWILLRAGDILSGMASTFHEYEEKDRISCYRRRAYAERGSIKNDTTEPPCRRASSSW